MTRRLRGAVDALGPEPRRVYAVHETGGIAAVVAFLAVCGMSKLLIPRWPLQL
jgi:hypothetical protein